MMAKGDINGILGCLRYNSARVDKIGGKVINANPNTFSYVRQESVNFVPQDCSYFYLNCSMVDFCAQIIPWNFPLLMLASKAISALAAGNTIVR